MSLVDLDPAADGVIWLRLNRPDALNALTRDLTAALEDAVAR
ncbi:MAG: enoyl-CoA hydratase, partial [Candidatus Rokubacteria bacterium]|nr:enoyl-CoA hydratase [Candidatus Rokubacteria bacterium]